MRRTTTSAALVGLLLAACAGADDSNTVDDGSEGPGEAAAVAEEDDGAEPVATDPPEELTSDDGWNGVHDGVDLPPAGEGVLVVDGEHIDLAVTCSAGGPLANLGGAAIFAFQARGDGVDAQGREMYVEVVRRLVSVEEGERTVYEYTGQEHGSVQIVVATGDDSSPYHSSIIVSPADDDRTGSMLPVVRVAESGSFTVVEDDVAPMHDQALHGAVELAGTCPPGWPEDA